MLLANSDGYRRNFTPVEEAAALFAAHEAGRDPDPDPQVHRPQGRGGQDRAAGGQPLRRRPGRRPVQLASQLTLDQLALLAEFDGDPDAVAAGRDRAAARVLTVEYAAERIRQDRAEAAEHERLRAELEAAGITGHRRPARRGGPADRPAPRR